MKKNFKFMIPALFAGLLCVGFASCGDDKDEELKNDEKNETKDEVTLESISFTTSTQEATVGDEFQLKLVGTPSDAKISKVTYSSDDESVASVDESGNVTCKGEGIAKIKAKVSGVSSAQCVVTVKGKTEDKGEEKEDPNKIDLTNYNIFAHQFVLTDFSCDEITVNEQDLMNEDIHLNVQTAPGCAEKNYNDGDNHTIDFVVGNYADVDLYLREYNYRTQELAIDTDEDIYSGTVTFTQDDEKVYIHYSGESYRGGRPLIMEGYCLKSKLQKNS